MIAEKKIEKNCLLYSLNIQTAEFLLFMFINKNSIHIYN